MRTTVTIDDGIFARARAILPDGSVSRLLETALAEWLRFRSERALENRLAAEYEAGEADSSRVAEDFSRYREADWPDEW